ncbi:tRNA (adenosine(37)-N6)-dimethylallyltransferase MiaA [Ichthyobacterium seriolicida]|uniref:tRNA dimethylallyltransferase n=1 Tax=Ichthyobacterium seriolicida TaxID=242600 RepID=A0A1J1DZD2_9FLAO|nr:tRNA (adenosine(37)-N6)-dimethylallyltransferase MiaA [Ichthyobacterium seriolicida]BAV95271.1 tRNA delta(2)-isopentenylpyrophosphate transferase [Ichthyobacterium seriolicida]
MNKKYLIAVLGPTAIGKTTLSIRLAKYFNTEIISCDSRQFFKELKIGAAPPSDFELSQVNHHFIANKSICDHYDVGLFENEGLLVLREIFQRKDIVIMVGGSGLYANSLIYGLDDFPKIPIEVREDINNKYREKGLSFILEMLEGLDPIYFERVDKSNHMRIIRALGVSIYTGKPYSDYLGKKTKKRFFTSVQIGLNIDRDILYSQIESRVDGMIECGLVQEVESLVKYRDKNALNTVGYKELFKYLDRECSLEESVKEIKKNTRNFAKRQLTWFRKNRDLKWFDPMDFQEIVKYCKDMIL